MKWLLSLLLSISSIALAAQIIIPEIQKDIRLPVVFPDGTTLFHKSISGGDTLTLLRIRVNFPGY